jgi:hypothetical protein
LQQTFIGVGNMSNSLEQLLNVEDVIEARSQNPVENDELG